VLVFVPGGGWVYGKRILQGYALMSHLAEQGWLCVAIDHRAGPGHRWPRHVQDVKTAVAWVRANVDQFGGDPSFVAIAGASSGAHLAALSALTHDDPDYGVELTPDADASVDAVIALYGRYDWEDRSTRQDKGFVQFLEWIVVGKRMEHHPHVFKNASPIALVRPDAPPFLVVHGTADRFVPVERARAFVEKLQSTSRSPVGYLELPDARHGFDMTDGLRTGTAVTAIRLFLEEIRRTHQSTSARRVI
jgi:acetyl esterase/lipase